MFEAGTVNQHCTVGAETTLKTWATRIVKCRRNFLVYGMMLLAFVGFTNKTMAQNPSGTCGANLTWELDMSNTLTIYGSGAMTDYNGDDNLPPWYNSYHTTIKMIVIGDSVTTIGETAFPFCSNLSSVTIGNGVITIGDDAFHGCSKLTSVIIGNSVTTIGFSVFEDCSNLTSITIPNCVRDIEERVFYDCSNLTSVIIGSGVESIGDYAFWGCRKLSSITCKAVIPPTFWNSSFKNGVPNTIPIYVPCISVSAYQTKWTDFSNFIAFVATTAYLESICEGESYDFLGETYTVSGTYSDTFPDINGCDSIVKLTLTVKPLPAVPIISKNENMLISSSATGNQWYLNNQPIVGATNQTYTYTQNGQYAVEVTNECGSTKSAETTINGVGIVGANGYSPELQVYPNPTKNELRLQNYELQENSVIEIYSVVGQLVYQINKSTNNQINNITIDVSHLDNGMYYLKIDNKVVRFVKE